MHYCLRGSAEWEPEIGVGDGSIGGGTRSEGRGAGNGTMLCAAAKMQKRTAPTFINPCKTKRAALGFFITRAPFLARLGQKRNSEKSGASPLRLSKKEEAMPKESHTKAEDHHESAAKPHRMAAALCCGKKRQRRVLRKKRRNKGRPNECRLGAGRLFRPSPEPSAFVVMQPPPNGASRPKADVRHRRLPSFCAFRTSASGRRKIRAADHIEARRRRCRFRF